MIILFFDLGDNMGVAAGNTSAAPICSTVRLGGSKVPMAKRCHKMMLETRNLIQKHEPDLLAIEAPYLDKRFPNAARALFQYLGCANGVASTLGVRVEEYTVSSIRQHFISAGGLRRAAAKDTVMDTCRVLGWAVKNDNEGDAAAGWEYARSREKLSNMMPTKGLF